MSDDEALTAPPAEPEATGTTTGDAADGSEGVSPVPAADATATQLQPVAATTGDETAPDELETLRHKCAELNNQLLRRRADFENYRRRVERERALVAVDAEAALLKELLPTIDNMERAVESATEESPLRDGLALIYRELIALFSRLGVVVRNPSGQPFDPETDEALVHDYAPGIPAGHVAEVLRKGYSYQDRLLRPAWVKVAKGEPTPEDPAPDSDDETVH
jgi:molecular chaperone GrpE